MGRAESEKPQSLFLHPLQQPPTPPVLGPDEAVTMIMRWNHYYSSVPWSAWSTGRAKDPRIPQLCSGRKLHSLSQCLSASLWEFCTNHRTQKGESFIQNPAAAAALHLSLFEELTETSQQVLSSRWTSDCQGSCSTVLLQPPSENIQNPHTLPLFYLLSVMTFFFFFLNTDLSTNRKFKTLPLHLQARFWVTEVYSVNVFKILSAAMKAGTIFFIF